MATSIRPQASVNAGARPFGQRPRPERPLGSQVQFVAYSLRRGVADFADRIEAATPLQLIETERYGVARGFVKDVANYLGLSQTRVVQMLGLPIGTLSSKHAASEPISGAGGQAAIRLARLITRVQELVAGSTNEDALTLDVPKWLGQWLEVPQPALGGRRPAELLDTPTGTRLVQRLLGAIESGSYQ